MKHFSHNKAPEPPSGTELLPLALTTKPAPSLLIRVLLLAACITSGSIIGYIGQQLTGDSAWFLAVPVCIAIAWFVIANPDTCTPNKCQRQPDGPPH